MLNSLTKLPTNIYYTYIKDLSLLKDLLGQARQHIFIRKNIEVSPFVYFKSYNLHASIFVLVFQWLLIVPHFSNTFLFYMRKTS